MSDIVITMEYRGEEWPPQITKQLLAAISEDMGDCTLKTNMGIDLHTSEVESDSNGHEYKGIKIERL